MCGRFTLYQPEKELQERFDALIVRELPGPSYNIAPTQPVVVVRAQEEERRLETLAWGLAPRWAKRPLINIRADTLADPGKSYFRTALARRRCIIPASGFYEWKEADNPDEGGKTPIYFHPQDNAILGFAGIWDGETCAIVTTEPNALASRVHDRMPVILPRALERQWLDPTVMDTMALAEMLRPYAGGMEAYPVSPAVNRPANNDPTLIEQAGTVWA